MNGMFLQLMWSNPGFYFAVVITCVVSITLHELAHGVAAIKLGDDTPRYTGHMTGNPLVHMGVTSIAMLLLFGIAFGAMPVDRSRLRGKYAEAIVAVAGPLTNLVLGIGGLVCLGLLARFGVLSDGSQVHKNMELLLWVFGSTNLALMLFNLIPVPPLDGSYILANLVPSYRQLMSAEMVRGVMTAAFFALFLGAGTFIYSVADQASVHVLDAVAGTSSDASP